MFMTFQSVFPFLRAQSGCGSGFSRHPNGIIFLSLNKTYMYVLFRVGNLTYIYIFANHKISLIFEVSLHTIGRPKYCCATLKFQIRTATLYVFHSISPKISLNYSLFLHSIGLPKCGAVLAVTLHVFRTTNSKILLQFGRFLCSLSESKCSCDISNSWHAKLLWFTQF